MQEPQQNIFVPWEVVESQKEYADLPEPNKQNVKRAWFDRHMRTTGAFSSLPEDQQTTVLNNFLAPKVVEQKDPGFLSNMGSLAIGGGKEMISNARVSGDVISGSFDKDTAQQLSGSLNRPEGIKPPELKQAQESFAPYTEQWNSGEKVSAVLGAIGNVVTQAVTNPKGVAYLSAEQAANMAPALAMMYAGGLTGGAVGSMGGPVTGTIGAVAGGVAGGFAGGVTVEAGAEFKDQLSQYLQANRLEPTVENIQSVLDTPEIVTPMLSAARKKAAVTAGTDAALNMAAGGIVRKTAMKAATVPGKVARIGAASAVNVGGEGVSDQAGRYAASGNINVGEGALEILGGAPGAVTEIPAARKLFNQKYQESDPKISVLNKVKSDLESGVITPEFVQELSKRQDIIDLGLSESLNLLIQKDENVKEVSEIKTEEVLQPEKQVINQSVQSVTPSQPQDLSTPVQPIRRDPLQVIPSQPEIQSVQPDMNFVPYEPDTDKSKLNVTPSRPQDASVQPSMVFSGSEQAPVVPPVVRRSGDTIQPGELLPPSPPAGTQQVKFTKPVQEAPVNKAAWIDEFKKTYSKSAFADAMGRVDVNPKWNEFKKISQQAYKDGQPIDEHFEIFEAELRKRRQAESTQEAPVEVAKPEAKPVQEVPENVATVSKGASFKQLAYNYEREIGSVYDSLESNINGEILAKETIKDSDNEQLLKISYKDIKGVHKIAYIRRMGGNEAVYEDSIISIKEIPNKNIESFFKEAKKSQIDAAREKSIADKSLLQQELDSAGYKIDSGKINNPDTFDYWVNREMKDPDYAFSPSPSSRYKSALEAIVNNYNNTVAKYGHGDVPQQLKKYVHGNALEQNKSKPLPDVPETDFGKDQPVPQGSEKITEQIQADEPVIKDSLTTEPKAREPWEMSLDEWESDVSNGKMDSGDIIKTMDWIKENSGKPALEKIDTRMLVVAKALSEGKPVPDSVLADYPDLKPTVKQKLTAENPELGKQERKNEYPVKYQDGNENNVVYDKDDYRITVDKPNNSRRIVLWNNQTVNGREYWKKVGELQTTQKTKKFRGMPEEYLSVSEIAIEKQHRGSGLGKRMYQVLIDHAPAEIKGIASYTPNRVNKKQVPAIYKRLGAKEYDDYQVIPIERGEKTPIEEAARVVDGLKQKPKSRQEINREKKNKSAKAEQYSTKPQTETKEFLAWFKDSKVVDEDGKPLVVYHQTGEEAYNDLMDGSGIFKKQIGSAGKNDFETPLGYFFKSSKLDIGLAGKKQIPVYLSAQNMITFKNRQELSKFLSDNIPEWKALKEEYNIINAKNDRAYNETNEKEDKEYEEWYKTKKDDEKYESSFKGWWDQFFKNWTKENDAISQRMKPLVTKFFESSGYDGILLKEDEGGFGKRTTDSYIVFNPTQIKSVFNRGTFDENNPDIRYATSGKSEGTITLQDVQSLLSDAMKNHGVKAGLSPDGKIWVRTRDGFGTTIENVDWIDANTVAFEMGRGRMKRDGEVIAGKFDNGKIQISRVGDKWTIAHEMMGHWLEHIGKLGNRDIVLLKREIVRRTRQGKFIPENKNDIGGAEDRANFIADQLNADIPGRIGQIMAKVRDFLDRLVNVFRRTSGGVIRDIKEGSIFDKEADKSQSDIEQYSTSDYSPEAIQKLTQEYEKYITEGIQEAAIKWKNNKKPDLALLDTIISTPLYHWTETDKNGKPKFEAMHRMFHHALNSRDDFYEEFNGLTYSTEGESMISIGERLLKLRPDEYNAINAYLKHRDMNQVGYRIKNEDGAWTLHDPDGKKVATYDNEDDAKFNQIQNEVNDFKNGRLWKDELDLAKEILTEEEFNLLKNKEVSELGSKWLESVRVIQDRSFEKYMVPAREIVRKAKQEAIDKGFVVQRFSDKFTVWQGGKQKGGHFESEEEAWDSIVQYPSVVYEDEKGNKTQINYRVALSMMGDRRGYYMPRIRKPGRLALHARKKGVNPIREHFDMAVFNDTDSWWKNIVNAPTSIQRRAKELKREGYDIEIVKNNQVSEDVFEMISPALGAFDVVNKAMEKTGTIKGIDTLKSMSIETSWRKDRDGNNNFYLKGSLFKQGYDDMLKDLGGEYSYAQKMGSYGTPQWKFKNAPGDIEEKISQRIFEFENINPDFETKFTEMLGLAIADIIKGRGSRSHMMARDKKFGKEVWTGYETDALQAIGTYAKKIAAGEAKRQLAINLAKDFTGTWETWDDYKKQAEEKGEAADYKEYKKLVRERRVDSSTQKNAYKEGKVFIQDVLRNQEATERVLGTLKGAAVLKFLAFRVFSAPLVNLTALPTSAVGSLVGHGKMSINQAFRNIANGGRYYVQYRSELSKGISKKDSKLSSEIRTLFDDMRRKGWYEAYYDQEGLSILRSKAGKTYQKLIDVGMYTFAGSESFNRAATISGAFIGLRKQGMSYDDALQKAKEISDQSHGVYHKANIPHIARGGHWGSQALKSFYMFKTFSHNYLLNMKKLGLEKEYKALSWLALSPAILAGAGASVLTPVISQLFKAFGYEDDPEEEIYSAMENAFGDTGETIGRHGLFGLLNMNLKGSLSIDVGVGAIPTTFKDLLGAPAGVISDLADSAGHFINGEYLKSAEKAFPLAASNLFKAYREETEGATTKSGAPVFFGDKQLEPSIGDTMIRALGFNPAGISGKREKQWKEKIVDQNYKEQRDDIYSQLRKFFMLPVSERTHDKYAEIVLDIQEYNEKIQNKGLSGRVPFLTGRAIKTNLKRSFSPSRAERNRGDE